jgi:hypothetical protein
MKMRLINFICLFTILLVISCAGTPGKQTDGHDHEHSKFTKHLEDSIMQAGEKGLFNIEMVIPEKKLKTGVNTVDIIIHDRRDRDTTGADITVTPWMPDPSMNHGAFSKPVIIEKGNGLYTVENIVLVMKGHWELRINIKWGSEVVTEDNVVFDFPGVRSGLK